MEIKKLLKYGIPERIIQTWEQNQGEKLLPLQSLAATRFGLLDGESLIISAPTSSGKTFCGEMAAVSSIFKQRKVIYLVLLKAIAEEKFADFKEKYSGLGRDCLWKLFQMGMSSKEHIQEMNLEELKKIIPDNLACGMKEEVKRQETNNTKGVLQYDPTFKSLKRQVIKNGLVLDGSLVQGKYAIILDDRKILLSHKSFKYLCKLAWAVFNKEGGWIHKLDLEEGENQGKYIYRLKKELSLSNGKLIENNRIGCYRLNLKKEKIQLNKKLLENFEDYEIKKLLEEME
jgi:hypothetical protein